MFTLRLAWRSLWRNSRRTLITMVSIAFGLAIAIFFIGMAEGMYGQMIDQIVRMQAGHITLEQPEYAEAPSVDLWTPISAEAEREIRGWPEVERTKRLVLAGGMAKSAGGGAPMSLMGVEPEAEQEASPVARNIVHGEYLVAGDKGLAVIGRDMAHRLEVEVGKKIVLTSNDSNGEIVESLFRVKGIFATGSEEFDAVVVQVPLAGAARLLRLPEGAVHQFGIVLKDAADQPRVLKRARRRFASDRLAVLPWEDVMPDLTAFMRLDKGSNYVFQALLILVVMFTIFNTILMGVLERLREFAVLLAVGEARAQLGRQIFVESVLLSAIGCIGGVLLGVLACGVLNAMDVSIVDLYGEGVTISGFTMNTSLSTSTRWPVIVWPTAIVFMLTLLLTVIPVRRALRVSIADTLRG